MGDEMSNGQVGVAAMTVAMAVAKLEKRVAELERANGAAAKPVTAEGRWMSATEEVGNSIACECSKHPETVIVQLPKVK
jgi:hypothetical protein